MTQSDRLSWEPKPLTFIVPAGLADTLMNAKGPIDVPVTSDNLKIDIAEKNG